MSEIRERKLDKANAYIEDGISTEAKPESAFSDEEIKLQKCEKCGRQAEAVIVETKKENKTVTETTVHYYCKACFKTK